MLGDHYRNSEHGTPTYVPLLGSEGTVPSWFINGMEYTQESRYMKDWITHLDAPKRQLVTSASNVLSYARAIGVTSTSIKRMIRKEDTEEWRRGESAFSLVVRFNQTLIAMRLLVSPQIPRQLCTGWCSMDVARTCRAAVDIGQSTKNGFGFDKVAKNCGL
ncbi:hypothetical protein Tco_0945212 [Tanacetum coccineum]